MLNINLGKTALVCNSFRWDNNDSIRHGIQNYRVPVIDWEFLSSHFNIDAAGERNYVWPIIGTPDPQLVLQSYG